MVCNKLPSVAIVILNWNGRKYLEQFLPSVIKYSESAQIFVADNASTDDSLSFLYTHFPEVKLIIHTRNLGFCEGYNQALKQIGADYYVLLNSDVEVTANWLTPLINLLENDKTIAACQPKLKAFHQPTYFEYAGAGGGFIDYLGYPFCRGRLFETLEEDNGQYNDTIPVFWASGACMVVRAAAYHEASGLEPTFFAHMEEIDLCWRLQKIGHKIYYCGSSEVFHVGGGTLPKANPHKTYLNFRNGLALLYKNLPNEEFIKRILTRVGLDWVAATKFFLSGQGQDALAVFKAHWQVYKTRKYWQTKRKNENKNENVNYIENVIYPKSIVWEYFVKQKNTYKELNIPHSTALPA